MTKHLITGGQRSGKSRCAERLGLMWTSEDVTHSVAVLATAVAADDEMRQRIDRHRRDRPRGFSTEEVPFDLAQAIQRCSAPQRLLIVDCLPLWLTNWLMPAPDVARRSADWPVQKAEFLHALREARGPVVIVTNEIGSGVIPLEPEVRLFVDELGRLNQEVAQACDQITWMVAGQPFTQKVQKW